MDNNENGCEIVCVPILFFKKLWLVYTWYRAQILKSLEFCAFQIDQQMQAKVEDKELLQINPGTPGQTLSFNNKLKWRSIPYQSGPRA